MNTNKLPVVEAKGTNYQIGMAIGTVCRKQIRKRVSVNKKFYKLRTDIPYQSYVEKGMAFLEPCLKYFPQYVEELKGIANGAKLPFEDIFMCVVEEELVHVANDIPLMKCTTVATKTKEDKYILGHNEDYGAEYRDGLYVIKAKQKGNKPDFIGVGYLGTLPGSSIAINSKGIAFSNNSANSTGISLGVPKDFLLRAAIDAHTQKSAIKKLSFKSRSMGNNSIFVSKDGITCVETSRNKQAILSSKRHMAHTNHYLHHKFYDDKKRRTSKESVKRLYYADKKLENIKLKDEQTLKKILSNHKSGICSHPNKKISYMTIASSIAIPSEMTLKVAKGGPCKGRYITYKMK